MKGKIRRCQARHESKKDRADDRSADVDAHNAAPFGAVEAITLPDQGDVRLAGYRMSRANRFPLETNEYRDGDPKQNRAEIAKFLQNKRR